MKQCVRKGRKKRGGFVGENNVHLEEAEDKEGRIENWRIEN